MNIYLFLRRTHDYFSSKLLDFQAFTATVTMMLHLLKHDPSQQSVIPRIVRHDWKKIDQIIEIMDRLGGIAGETVATEGARILKILRGTGLEDDQNRGDIELSLPYFGSVIVSTSPRHVKRQPPVDGTPSSGGEVASGFAPFSLMNSYNPSLRNLPTISYKYNGSTSAESKKSWGDWLTHITGDLCVTDLDGFGIFNVRSTLDFWR